MRKYNINASIIQAIENLYDKAQSAVLFHGSIGEWFRTTVGVRQGCLLSPTLFNIFLERIMCEALDDHEGSVSIGGRLITNFRFADDIVVNAEEEEEAGVLIDRLDRTTTRYKIEIGPDKTKVMTNNSNGFQREIKIKGQRLEEVENFKYLGAIISNEGSKPEIISRIAQTTAALSRLKIIWRDKNISLASKVKLMRTLILSTFLYACESWTLTAEIERRIQALEMRCYRRLLNISYKDHVTNEEVRNRIQNAIGVHDDLLTMVKKRKLRWYGHISRSSGMAKTILQGTVKGARRRGRQKKRWEDNIKEWTGMGFGDSLRAAEDREGWKGIVATSSVVPRRPPRLRDWDEMRWVFDIYKCINVVSFIDLFSTCPQNMLQNTGTQKFVLTRNKLGGLSGCIFSTFAHFLRISLSQKCYFSENLDIQKNRTEVFRNSRKFMLFFCLYFLFFFFLGGWGGGV